MLPAVVLGLTLCALVWWRYRNEDLSGATRASGTQILRSLLIGREPLIERVVLASETDGTFIAKPTPKPSPSPSAAP